MSTFGAIVVVVVALVAAAAGAADQVAVCHNGTTLMVAADALAGYVLQGDAVGKCAAVGGGDASVAPAVLLPKDPVALETPVNANPTNSSAVTSAPTVVPVLKSPVPVLDVAGGVVNANKSMDGGVVVQIVNANRTDLLAINAMNGTATAAPSIALSNATGAPLNGTTVAPANSTTAMPTNVTAAPLVPGVLGSMASANPNATAAGTTNGYETHALHPAHGWHDVGTASKGVTIAQVAATCAPATPTPAPTTCDESSAELEFNSQMEDLFPSNDSSLLNGLQGLVRQTLAPVWAAADGGAPIDSAELDQDVLFWLQWNSHLPVYYEPANVVFLLARDSTAGGPVAPASPVAYNSMRIN